MIKTSGKTITLRDFSLMKDGSPIYYAENFGVEDYGFGKVLMPMNYGGKYLDEDTTDFSDIRQITGIDSVKEIQQSLWIMSNGDIFFKQILGSCDGDGRVVNIPSSSTGWHPDIKCTGVDENSKILFTYITSSKNPILGTIHRGKATGGSATTLVDTGVDFTTMSLAAGDVVYNIKDGKQFTIDAGGIAANTLTITAVAGGDFASGDNYAIIDDDWQALSYTGHHTQGLQIIEFDEDFYILDGDYLAMVDSADAFSGQHKALESGWIGKSGASNGDSLVIAANKNYKGKLFIWDKHSNGWNKKIALDNEIQSIIAYKNGYVFVCGNALWWTDTYTTRELSSFIATHERSDIQVLPNGMLVLKDKIVINGGVGTINRMKFGIWIYDISSGEWTYSPYEPGSDGEKTSYNASKGIVFFDSYINYIFYSFQNSGQGWTNANILSRLNLGSSGKKGTVITNPIRLGKNARIKKIEVNLFSEIDDSDVGTTMSKTISCKLSDCTRPVWRHYWIRAVSTDKKVLKVDGTSCYCSAVVGDEILIISGWNGHCRRKLVAIANKGSATEEWTLDSDLPELTANGTNFNILPFQEYGMGAKTIGDETETLEFYPDFLGDNVMIELGITGETSPNIAIESIKIYYE